MVVQLLKLQTGIEKAVNIASSCGDIANDPANLTKGSQTLAGSI